MARSLKFCIEEAEECTSYIAKTNALISFAVTAKLICVFVFAYAKSRFSHDEAKKIKVFRSQPNNYKWVHLLGHVLVRETIRFFTTIYNASLFCLSVRI